MLASEMQCVGEFVGHPAFVAQDMMDPLGALRGHT